MHCTNNVKFIDRVYELVRAGASDGLLQTVWFCYRAVTYSEPVSLLKEFLYFVQLVKSLQVAVHFAAG